MSEDSISFPSRLLGRAFRELTPSQVRVLEILAEYTVRNREEDVPLQFIYERYGRGTSVYNILKQLMAMKLVEKSDQERRSGIYRLTVEGRYHAYIYRHLENELRQWCEQRFAERIYNYVLTSDLCDGDRDLAEALSRVLARTCFIIVVSQRFIRNREYISSRSEILDSMLTIFREASRDNSVLEMIAVQALYIMSDLTRLRTRSDTIFSQQCATRLISISTRKPIRESIRWISWLIRWKYRKLAIALNVLIQSWIYFKHFLQINSLILLSSFFAGLLFLIIILYGLCMMPR